MAIGLPSLSSIVGGGGGSTGFGDIGLYSPDEVIVLIGGVMPARLLSDDTFVRISRSAPTFTTSMTPDGLVTRTKGAGMLYEVRLTLFNCSPTNDVLQTLFTIDEATGRGKFPLLIKNSLGGDMFFSTNSWIESAPDVEFGTSEGTREWVFKCGYATLNVGGSTTLSGAGGIINQFLGAGTAVASLFL